MTEQKMMTCPHCGREMPEHPEGKTYCMPCLEAKFKALRAGWKAEGWKG